MNKVLRIGIFSVALAQSLYGVDATEWWQLDEANNPPPPAGGNAVLNDPLVIFEDSTLEITTTGNPQNGFQQYNGNIEFNHNLDITLNVDGQVQADQSTPIYRLNGDGIKVFSGEGLLNLYINVVNNYAKSVFNLDNSTLISNVKTSITMADGAALFSIFRIGGGATLEINNDLEVDVSNSQGVFGVNNQISNRQSVFDNSGVVNVNINNSSETTIKISGDIYTSNSLTLNLANERSFFKGKFDAFNDSRSTINLSNRSLVDMDLSIFGNSTFTLNANSQSKVYADINFQVQQGSDVLFNIDNSWLYADFHYIGNLDFITQGNVTLSNNATWYLGGSNQINFLTIDNPQSNLSTENFKSLALTAVDMRFSNRGETLRDERILSEDNRYVLNAAQIRGSDGVFRLFGVLNREGWSEVRDENTNALTETIATDKIITNRLFNSHYIQIFWNANNFDKSLLNADLSDRHIIIAQQKNAASDSNLTGAVTPIGLYNYKTNLIKERFTYTDEQNQTQMGWQWVVSDVQRADNSYMTRLLDSFFQSQFRIFSTQLDTLNLRMGEIREMERVHSVWARSKYGRVSSASTSQTAPSWDEFASIWFGYDQNYYVLGGKNFLGGAFDVNFFETQGIPEEDDFSNPSYRGKSQSYGFSVYDTFIFDNGLYLDGIAKYYFTHNRFEINSEVLAGNDPEFFSHTFLVSLEMGKKFRLPIKTPNFNRSFYYLKPEIGFSFAFSSGQDWTFRDWSNQNVEASLDFNIPLHFRTGLSFGRQFDSRGYKGDVYLGTSIDYDINTGGDLRLEDFLDQITLTHTGNFVWRINAGTNVVLNEYWRIYFDAETAFFGTINPTFTLNGGVRINFGRLHPQMPYIPPRLDAIYQDEDFSKYPRYRRTIPEVQNYSTEGILQNYKEMSKIKKLPPQIKVKPTPYNAGNTNTNEPPNDLKITPQIQQTPQEAPIFIDNPTSIQTPQKNYKREENVPMYQQKSPDSKTRSMEQIRDDLNRGFQ